MNLITCLGNPGKEHARNRHNVGFMVADEIISQFSLVKKGKKFKSILYEGIIEDKKVLLIKPQTYMNLSGEAVQLAAGFYKIPKNHILTIYDDIDLPFGTIRLRGQGSAGTHNGMRSLISSLNSRAFPRIRIGIGPLPDRWDISNFVLSNFTKDEERALPDIIKNTVLMIESFYSDGLTSAMNEFN
ncbi:aminoacyl-tRNA hydrolase [Candidatus Margulisiibacteriota bacterium]